MLKINRFGHGGIMVNYRCNATCRHCLYACSPKREHGYMTAETATLVGTLLRRGGCRSIHIGGGEPFLSFDELIAVLKALADTGIAVDYIETNAFWARDEQRATAYLQELRNVGADTLCISVDPFHAEFVPPALPMKLAKLCEQHEMGYFLWQQRFIPLLSQFGIQTTHDRAFFEENSASDYIDQIARSYGITYGGRALQIEEEFGASTAVDSLLTSTPCTNLLSTNHYHVDLHGRFIPPSCTGIVLPLEQLVNGVQDGTFPVMDALLSGGVAALYRLACDEGFESKPHYTSRCAFCIHMRHFLAQTGRYTELNAEHYDAV